MQIQLLRKSIALAAFIMGALMTQTSLASVLALDNFTDFQSVTDRGNSAAATGGTLQGLAGTDLTNVSRTFTALATAGGYSSSTNIKAVKSLLNISNGNPSAGHASILWNFDPVDFTKFATGIVLKAVFIDLSASAEIIVNEIAYSGSKTFTGVDDFLVNFNEFSNSSVFSNVSSLRLNFYGPLGWDGQFKLLMDQAPRNTLTVTSVPLPSAYFLMSSALLGLIGVSRRKIRDI